MLYKLRQQCRNHSSDVRSISVLENDSFITTSRDKTTTIWDLQDTDYVARKVLFGHKHFVNCCCVLPKSDEFPEGLILTGGHDNIIIAYKSNSAEPYRMFSGHQNAVSTLCYFDKNKFASGSWDTTVKIWSITSGQFCNDLKQHTGSVFGLLVMNTNDYFLSASADKSINVYNWPTLEFLHKITGHRDCIRDLVGLNNNQFLSCSNDGTIRKWNAKSGMLLETLLVNDSFLYSITSIPDGSLIAACGENCQVFIINTTTEEFNELILPAVSVWSISMLSNFDIVTGSSDGIVRIFSAVTSRQANETELKEFEKEINVLTSSTTGTTDLQNVDAAGPEALSKPGTSNGQIMLVKEDNKIICYQWDSSLFNWTTVGDVTGVNKPNTSKTSSEVPKTSEDENSKKILFEGKLYDYVFNIDVKDGNPPLKLPFNNGNNYYDIADDFITKHDLPRQYKETIVNFLIQNTTQMAKCKTKTISPYNNYIKFENINYAKAKAKLLEFITILNGEKAGISNEISWVNHIIEMAENGKTPDEKVIVELEKYLTYGEEYAFPALDLLRVTMLHLTASILLCDKANFNLKQIITTYGNITSSSINNMLIIKILANMFSQKSGKDYLNENYHLFLKMCLKLSSKNDKTNSLENAIAVFIINLIILQNECFNLNDMNFILDNAFKILRNINSKEGILRIVTGIYTAVIHNNHVSVNTEHKRFLKLLAGDFEKDDIDIKISEISTTILKIFTN